ncbi:MAG TPA: hypothetical protein VEZ26_02820 [Sphingomonadaceae bacterium]|nr:hypothetical protein [Sphingomonadaceae bacterium]
MRWAALTFVVVSVGGVSSALFAATPTVASAFVEKVKKGENTSLESLLIAPIVQDQIYPLVEGSNTVTAPEFVHAMADCVLSQHENGESIPGHDENQDKIKMSMTCGASSTLEFSVMSFGDKVVILDLAKIPVVRPPIIYAVPRVPTSGNGD